MKYCRACNQSKPETAFNKCTSRSDGLQTQCRECKRLYLRQYVVSEHGKSVTSAYYSAHKAIRNEQCKKYYAANKARSNEKAREYYRDNQDKWAEYNKRWYENHKSYYRAKDALRGKRKQAVNKFNTSDDRWILKEAMELARIRTSITGYKWEVDHITPIASGGEHSPNNIQVVPMRWNRRKANKHTERYLGAHKE